MVYFVGAGCGAVDLITVRGAELLGRVDVIIYAGSLVNPELLNYAKKECEVYNSATMTLEEVVSTIEEAEMRNLTTVRLHTGDPSIYGAIREQMDILDEKGFKYEVVPGVSSFSGAASCLKAEFTLPGVSQTVILTRMEGKTPVPKGEALKSLASHGATMVIFLSAGLIEELTKEIIGSGKYSESTPAAIVYKATWPDEKIFRCTVGTLMRVARENNIKRTALILIGDFLEGHYERSRLYDPKFSTEFREAMEDEN